ncbi:MAG: dienelactone hydrolase family protein [Simkaniaceae bacterium]|nr:MAG: dienelactone hydrolase family protein [Simkaniaceae bacterium]
MKTEKKEYEHKEVTFEAFIAFDETIEKAPAILIFHAWKGRDEFVLEKAKWVSSLGYVGIALDMYGKGVLGSSPEENGKLMQPLLDDRNLLLSRMEAGLKVATDHPRVDKEKMGAMGFCFGGLCALDLARSGASIQGAISLHGLLSPPNYPTNPKGKILVLHGHDDPMVPPDQVMAFEEEMTKVKADWQVHVYGQTMHAFTNPIANDPKAGTVYSEIAEKRALQSVENFFSEIYQA